MLLNKQANTRYTIPITISPSVFGNHAELGTDSAKLQQFTQHKKMTSRFQSHIQNTGGSPPLDLASRGIHPTFKGLITNYTIICTIVWQAKGKAR